MESLTLYELNGLVRSTLEQGLPGAYWVQAELSEVRTAYNGHCYLEFVQKDARGNGLLAKARGIVWSGTFALLKPYFERETGQRLAPGLKVLVQVEVQFHELYGYSLTVVDIDPTYTLGDLARRRQEILKRLADEGVLTLNKELTLSRLPQRVAVISSSTAAGYGDFCKQLEGSPYRFTVKLFQAVMQGDRVEASVVEALNAVYAEYEQWDVVAILRGGGAVSDLNGFDTYPLAANCAQFPLPVLTGIGHERDETVLDHVAYLRLKTPTAVAAFLVERMDEEAASLVEWTRRLPVAVRARLAADEARLERLSARLPASARLYMARMAEGVDKYQARLKGAVLHGLQKQQYQLERCEERLHTALPVWLHREQARLRLLEKSIEMAGPERFFRLGFSLTRVNGRVVTDAAQLTVGDSIVTRFAKGEIESKVIGKQKKE